MSYISFYRINKLYDSGVHAIKDVTFDIEQDQFTVLVGPSGCGKSTLLRMLAGLEEITTGKILIDGKIINEVSPKDRNVSMVFQNYALYPHLTVYDNIAFGLRLKKVKTPVLDNDGNITKYINSSIPREEIDKKVKEVAEELELTDYLSRKPKQLSGGQKQRVALARALVRDNDIFLLDEPLSNLDAKLRVEMRKTIKALHSEVKKPFIYVTHDQVEAMTLADRIVVLNKGVVQQIGSPKEIFDEPNNLYVATFFGSPQMSIIEGLLTYNNKKELGIRLENDDFLVIPKDLLGQLTDYSLIDKKVKVGLRASSFRVSEGKNKDHFSKITCDFVHKELFGNETLLKLKLGSGDLLAFVPNNIEIKDKIELFVHTSSMKIFDIETGESIFGLRRESTFKDIKFNINADEISFEFASKEYKYPLESRCFHENLNQDSLTLKCLNEYISLEKKENSIEVEGEVSLIKNLFQRKAVYIKLKNQKEPLMFYVKKDEDIKEGSLIKVYVPLEYINFYLDDGKTPLLSKYEIHNNILKEDYDLVSKKLNITNKEFIMPLKGIKVIHKGDKIDKNEYKIFKVIVLDVENFGQKSLMYYKIKGMKGYFTALLEEEIDQVVTPVLKLVIKK